MSTNFQDVKSFMEAMEQIVLTEPTVPDSKTLQLRYNLIEEEVKETLDAISALQWISNHECVAFIENNQGVFKEELIQEEVFNDFVEDCFTRFFELSDYAKSFDPSENSQFNFSQFIEEVVQALLIEVADGLSDILVVTYGAGAAFGINLDQCMKEVHRSNMSKLHPETGKPVKRESDGKVIKDFPGSLYSPPDLKSILF